MFLKIFSLSPSEAVLRAIIRLSLFTSLRMAMMARSSTPDRSSKTNMSFRMSSARPCSLLFQALEDGAFEGAVHLVEDLRHTARTPPICCPSKLFTMEISSWSAWSISSTTPGETLSSLRHPIDDIGLKRLGELLHDRRRLARVEMGQDDGDRLGMLVADEVGDRPGVEAPDLLEEVPFPLFLDLLENRGRPALFHGLGRGRSS